MDEYDVDDHEMDDSDVIDAMHEMESNSKYTIFILIF